jgi:lipid-A-disaccharide synthase
LGVPMVIIYKISSLTYFIGKFIVHVKNIGLANIVAGKTIVPELIQEDASGNRIAAEAMDILTNAERKREMIKELAAIRSKLGNPGAARKAAHLAYDML